MALVRRDVFNELFNDVNRFPEEFQRMFGRNPALGRNIGK